MKNFSVSIIIPCHNEGKYIKDCLTSVLKQTYENIADIFVVDGRSDDDTKKIAEEFYPKVSVLDNEKKIFASACNIGIKKSKGDVIIILGCHAFYPPDYLKNCVECLDQYDADNAGGQITPVLKRKKIIADAIALSLSSFFGTGKRKIKMPESTDTVFGGCYKKEVFKKIGLFNENLLKSSDMELNMRLLKNGGKIIKSPKIVAFYYSDETLQDFFMHNIKDGIWAIMPFKITGKALKLRHYLPLFMILMFPVIILPYLAIAIFFSGKIAVEQKNIAYLFLMPIVFLIRHAGYGLGSAMGLFKILLNKE